MEQSSKGRLVGKHGAANTFATFDVSGFIPDNARVVAPDDVREITEERYQLKRLLAQGYESTMNENAEPIVIPSPAVAPVDLDRSAKTSVGPDRGGDDWIGLLGACVAEYEWMGG